MRVRRSFVLLLANLFVIVAALALPTRALAGNTNIFIWGAPPDAARLEATVAEMKRIAEARSDLVRVSVTPRSIVLTAVAGAHEEFVFPGNTNAASANEVKTDARPHDTVVAACLLVANDHFRGEELAIHTEPGDTVWAPARALFRSVLGREPKGYLARAGDTAKEHAESPFMRFSGMIYPILFLGFLYAMSRGNSSPGASWGSYYLFWMLGPIALSLLAAHPAILLVVPIALIARPWLPDPILYFRYAGRVRSLVSQAAANPGNITARRDLAMIWLEQRRPRRALVVAEEALARDPSSAELHYLRGLCLLAIRDYENAVAEFIDVVQRDPRFRYGDPYLRAADALIALRRWDDADDALERFSEAQRSSVEGWYKHALVYRERGDIARMKEALRNASGTYEGSPQYHRRKQLGWYLRARLRALFA